MSARRETIKLSDLTGRERAALQIQSIERVRSKYGNRKTVVDNYVFDSQKEANRYGELKLLERGGEIQALTIQPEYELIVEGERVCKYRGDFRYVENGKVVVEDVKSKITRTRLYSVKRKLMKVLYAIEIRET